MSDRTFDRQALDRYLTREPDEEEDSCADCGKSATDEPGGLQTWQGHSTDDELCDDCYRQRITDEEEAEDADREAQA